MMAGLLNVAEFLVAFGAPFGLGVWASRRAERARHQTGRWGQ